MLWSILILKTTAVQRPLTDRLSSLEHLLVFFFITLKPSLSSSLLLSSLELSDTHSLWALNTSLELSDTNVYEPWIRARPGTTVEEPRAGHLPTLEHLLFFLMTLKPRVGWYNSLWALNTRNHCAGTSSWLCTHPGAPFLLLYYSQAESWVLQMSMSLKYEEPLCRELELIIYPPWSTFSSSSSLSSLELSDTKVYAP